MVSRLVYSCDHCGESNVQELGRRAVTIYCSWDKSWATYQESMVPEEGWSPFSHLFDHLGPISCHAYNSLCQCRRRFPSILRDFSSPTQTCRWIRGRAWGFPPGEGGQTALLCPSFQAVVPFPLPSVGEACAPNTTGTAFAAHAGSGQDVLPPAGRREARASRRVVLGSVGGLRVLPSGRTAPPPAQRTHHSTGASERVFILPWSLAGWRLRSPRVAVMEEL